MIIKELKLPELMTAVTVVLKFLSVNQKTTISHNKHIPPDRKALSLPITSRKATSFRGLTFLMFSFLLMLNLTPSHRVGVFFQICSFSESLNYKLKIIDAAPGK